MGIFLVMKLRCNIQLLQYCEVKGRIMLDGRSKLLSLGSRHTRKPGTVVYLLFDDDQQFCERRIYLLGRRERLSCNDRASCF